MSDEAATEALRNLLSGQADPARPAGWKVALNVAAVQKRLGLTHSLVAPLATLRTHESGASLVVDAASQLHVEAEIALLLARDLDREMSHDELRASIESYTPCLELVDYVHPRTSLETMFSHRFFHAGIVLGTSRTKDELLAPGHPSAVGAEGRVHARLPNVVPDDLVDALHGALARVLEVGGALRRGQLLLCGSYIEPVPLPAGTTVRVDYGAQGILAISRAA